MICVHSFINNTAQCVNAKTETSCKSLNEYSVFVARVDWLGSSCFYVAVSFGDQTKQQIPVDSCHLFQSLLIKWELKCEELHKNIDWQQIDSRLTADWFCIWLGSGITFANENNTSFVYDTLIYLNIMWNISFVSTHIIFLLFWI